MQSVLKKSGHMEMAVFALAVLAFALFYFAGPAFAGADATLRLNRPGRRNSLRDEDLRTLLALIGEVNDDTRIRRALEVAEGTGRPLAAWQRTGQQGIGGDVAITGAILLPPRDALRARCDARAAAMLDDGAVDEVAAPAGMSTKKKILIGGGVAAAAGLYLATRKKGRS